MTPPQWERLKQIVTDALELETAARRAFVAEACGDDAVLRCEVESILSQTPERFDVCVDRLTIARSVPEHLNGRRLGAYEIVEEIGRGGMGAVYLARRADEQFDKEVAIKVLKRGTDTDEVLRRFRAERQILARLEHPNIARLLDAGTTDDELPYFVMEYVAGERITDFCSTRALGVRERVELFLKVCSAVQFAHRNLVVHRDLKPGNILVTQEGEPKLLDFGIAKLVAGDGDSPDATLTLPDQQRLTPAYASPEQVRGEPVTTASDVYSLGALLYELLAGEPPHRFSGSRPSATELFRVVVEEESRRASVAAPASELRRELRGDLDNILLTALRKEPERRYSGVAAFTDDLRRYLESRPVRARPATLTYRASRFVRRNKIGVTAAAFVLLAVIGGATAYVLETRRSAYHAQREAAHFRDVRKLANLFIFKYHDGIAALPGSTELRKELVKDALDYLNNLSGKGTDDPELLREIATAYKRIGNVQQGVLVNDATGGTLSIASLGDTAGAFENYRKALQIREQLAALQPGNKTAQFELADSYNNLGGNALDRGKPAEAVDHFRRSIVVLRPLLERDPTDISVLALLKAGYGALAGALAIWTPNVGDIAGGLEAQRNSISIAETLLAREPQNVSYRQSLGVSYGDMGRVLFNDGKIAEALEYYRKALAIGESLHRENAGHVLTRRELAVQHRNVGTALIETGAKEEALEHFRRAVGLFEGLMKEDPMDARIRRSAAYGYRDLAEALAANGDRANAAQNFATALAMFEDLTAKDPKNAVAITQQTLTHLKMSRFFADGEEVSSAIVSARRSVELGESLVAADPKDSGARKTLAESYGQLGRCFAVAGAKGGSPEMSVENWQQARSYYQQSLATWVALRDSGKLSEADAKKHADIASELNRCDTVLAQISSPASTAP